MSGTETNRRVDKAIKFYNESLADHESKSNKGACDKDCDVCNPACGGFKDN